MDLLHQLLGPDIQAGLFIIVNLIVIESLLSVDNAAVLATMVMDLPQHQRQRALKYGILGAYVFRGICLVFAAWLIAVWWLKPLGGFYLLYLAISYFWKRRAPTPTAMAQEAIETEVVKKESKSIYRFVHRWLGSFWATVALVELMDLAFSIDNVFAAVAYVENIPAPYNLRLVWIGVFIGILAMRFVAQSFVRLLERFPALERSAFLVIGILGAKLSLSLLCHWVPDSKFCMWLSHEESDVALSVLTLALFAFPVIVGYWQQLRQR